MTNAIVVLCACGSEEEAERIARMLVERGLAGCVNITAPMRSIYRWQGNIESAAEWLLTIKTLLPRFGELSEMVRAAHSYEVPEIIALPVLAGSRDYLAWLAHE